MAGSDVCKVADNAPAVLPPSLGQKVMTTPILVVGAGGIGCELLKNLVLSGFKKMTVVRSYIFSVMSFPIKIFSTQETPFNLSLLLQPYQNISD